MSLVEDIGAVIHSTGCSTPYSHDEAPRAWCRGVAARIVAEVLEPSGVLLPADNEDEQAKNEDFFQSDQTVYKVTP